MTQADIARPLARPIRIFSTVALAALVAGCQAFQGAEATRTDASSGLSNSQLVERDIEAPEIFSVQDLALWDGRPSLGGIWVAAVDVRQPERVIMRNPQTGKQVIGGLFKKEHPDDGLALMLSSDAAIALGVPAGQPTDISVVALRTPEEPDLPVASSEPFDVEGVTSAEDYLEGSAQTAAAAGVATATLGAETAEDLAAEAVSEATETADTVIDLATETGEAAATPEPTLMERVAAAVAATDAADAARAAAPDETASVEETAAAAAAVLSATAASLPEAAATPLPEASEPASDAIAAQAPDVLAPVPSLEDQIAAAVAATEAAEEAARAEGRYVPVAQTGAAPGVSTTSLDTEASSSGPHDLVSQDFIQIGTYGTEAAANAATDRFDGAGFGTQVKAATRGGRTVYRAILGPVLTTDEQSAALRKAREFGFDDAYPVGG